MPNQAQLGEPSPREIRELLVSQVLELPDDFDPGADLFKAGLDSMAIMQLLLQLEERYSIQVPMGEVTRENFGTTEAIARLVGRKQASTPVG